MRKKGKKERRRLLLISLITFVLLTFFASGLYKNFMQILNNRKEAAKLEAEYESLIDRQKSLTSEVTKMQDPNYVARYAKEKYLYSQEGEIIIRID